MGGAERKGVGSSLKKGERGGEGEPIEERFALRSKPGLLKRASDGRGKEEGEHFVKFEKRVLSKCRPIRISPLLSSGIDRGRTRQAYGGKSWLTGHVRKIGG